MAVGRGDCGQPDEGHRVVEFLLLALLGAGVGVFGTIVGAGGGFVLVPILLVVYNDRDPQTLTAMSLFVVMINAASGSIAYARHGRIDFFSGGWFAVATLPGAVAGVLVVGYVPRRLFDGIFATLLAVVGLYLLLRSGFQAIREPITGRGVVQRTLRDNQGNTFVYSYRLWQGLAISAGIGFISSLLGLGGGIIHVPVMIEVLHFPVHIATATSQFVLGLMAAEGVSVHFATGNLGWNSTLGEAVALSVGAVPGAQLGARIARRLQGTVILRLLAGSLLIVAARLALLAAGI